jgi:hypothetical protein
LRSRSNEAADRTTTTTKAKGKEMSTQATMSPTYATGDVEGYAWTATNMPTSICERAGVTSSTASDALASLAAGAWQANNRHIYVAACSEMKRRGLLEDSK